jgi:prolyl oligopeptidase
MQPPHSAVEAVRDILHGVVVTDPYRWLEDQDTPQTREWLAEQSLYARTYLDAIPGRNVIRERIRELLDVEACDSFLRVGRTYIFRNRTPGQQQPSIFLREGPEGEDQLLLDPAERGTGVYTAVRPLQLSPDQRLLLYEVKEGGERAGVFELFDIKKRSSLPDVLPHGYLRGFAFAPESRGFYYVHEPSKSKNTCRAVFHHILGSNFNDDTEVFSLPEDEPLQLLIVPGEQELGFLVYRIANHILTDFYVWSMNVSESPVRLIGKAQYRFGPRLMNGRILAITDRDAPNSKIVEVCRRSQDEPEFIDLISMSDASIRNWMVSGDRIYVAYARGGKTEIHMFDLSGKVLGSLPVDGCHTVRLIGGSSEVDEIFFERESFTKPVETYRYSYLGGAPKLWAQRSVPFDSAEYRQMQVWYASKDGTSIPMFLVGCHDALEGGCHPAIMSSYGGYGVPMTPQFSVFVAFMMERGCLFALPGIRGGLEFGSKWHQAAKRRNRQIAYDDFLAGAEWLISTGRTDSQKLGIFGGSNSGLLVAAALTQRPDLFRAVVCMVPLTDMLRYHLFDNAQLWKDEFGTSDDPEDFAALLEYSPYQRVTDGVSYPATLIVSGDADQSCNPLHARKMAARLQAANTSQHPILLDYDTHRGHAPVLPLNDRIEALTDRLAFLCDQLQISL